MKLLVAGLAALVLGLAGGSLVSGMRVRDVLLAAAADSAAAHGEEHGAEQEAPEVHVEPGHAVTPEVVVEHAADSMAEVHEAVAPVGTSDPAAVTPPAASTNPLVAQASTSDGAEKLARIFAAMQPEDAARVLAELEDAEIVLILQHVGDRLAAQILGAFPPQRAASLSRVVLGVGPEGV